MKILYLFLTLLLVFSTGSAQPSVWNSVGIGAGGAFYSPAINPANPDEIYTASATGAMFRTTNLAVSWQTVNFRIMQTSDYIVSKVQYTVNSNILYVLATDPAQTSFAASWRRCMIPSATVIDSLLAS